MPFFSYLTERSDILDIILRHPRRYAPMDTFTQRLLRGPSELSVHDRELIAAYVSGLNACQYCQGIHTAVAERFGMAPGLLQQLLEAPTQAGVDTRLLPILAFAKKLTLTPSKMLESDARAVYTAGWSERTLEDVIGIVGLFNFYNRLLDGHGIKGHAAAFAEGSTQLAKRGYRIPWPIGRLIRWQRQRAARKAAIGRRSGI